MHASYKVYGWRNGNRKLLAKAGPNDVRDEARRFCDTRRYDVVTVEKDGRRVGYYQFGFKPTGELTVE